jgi:hypothetical protein
VLLCHLADLKYVLWRMEHPDKFEMYIMGILFLQVMCRVEWCIA